MTSYLYLDEWNAIGKPLAMAVIAAGFLVVLYHFLRLLLTSDLKKRYDYINKNEIKTLWIGFLFMIIGLAIFTNTLVREGEIIWLLVRIFVTIMMGLIVAVIISNLLKFYYPFYVEKRLRKLRYTPRVSPKTGKPMKLLSEEEEDVYLDEGMQAEENVFSVDYDVWIDEETGFTKIEKYAGHLVALQCPECSYQTLKVVKEEILESPTENEEGELMKFFKCDYCGYKERKAFRIARLKKVAGLNKSSSTLST
ncbi:MAG TPA: hypothetical protein VI583_05030 [Cyclobacteriaceae bacterium]|nr:hypothetical protein [Cyclobacteriaceae bacterium]